MNNTTKQLQQYVSKMRSIKNFKNRPYDLLMGLRGEIYEFDNEYNKKLFRDLQHMYNEDDAKEEMADILIYAISICNKEEWDMYDIIDDKMNKWE